MDNHNPDFLHAQDKAGEKLWKFGFRYKLPETPSDGRHWFTAISIVEESLREQPRGTALPKGYTLLLLIDEYGIYSNAFEAAKRRADRALALGGLAASELYETTYLDLSEPIETDEPPF